MNIYSTLIKITFIIFLFNACKVSKSYPKKYFLQNESTLKNIQNIFNKTANKKPIAIAYTNWSFDELSVEMKSDTVRYIYDFKLGEPRIKDTLRKYGYDTTAVLQIMQHMKTVRCTWINTLDYYVDNQKNTLLFMGVNAKRFVFNLKAKYYLFNFYEQPQYYDKEGRLLNKKSIRELRIINNEVFYRITDKVCYTISSKFR